MFLSISKILKIFAYIGPIFCQKTTFFGDLAEILKTKSYYKKCIGGHSFDSIGPIFVWVRGVTVRATAKRFGSVRLGGFWTKIGSVSVRFGYPYLVPKSGIIYLKIKDFMIFFVPKSGRIFIKIKDFMIV